MSFYYKFFFKFEKNNLNKNLIEKLLSFLYNYVNFER